MVSAKLSLDTRTPKTVHQNPSTKVNLIQYCLQFNVFNFT